MSCCNRILLLFFCVATFALLIDCQKVGGSSSDKQPGSENILLENKARRALNSSDLNSTTTVGESSDSTTTVGESSDSAITTPAETPGGGSMTTATTQAGGGDTVPLFTTPQPTECTAPCFKLVVQSKLSGVTAQQFGENVGGFKETVAALHEGRSSPDVVVTNVEELIVRRRLLATSVTVDYEIRGFESEVKLNEAKTLHESSAAGLTEGLKTAGFDSLTGIEETVKISKTVLPPEDSAAWRSNAQGLWLVGITLCTLAFLN